MGVRPQPEAADLDSLLAQWYAPAYRTAALLLSDYGRAEDAVQDAFTRLWRFQDSLPSGDGLRPFIYRVVVNACYSAGRSEQRHAGRRAAGDELGALRSTDPAPDEVAEELERADIVRRALGSLPASLRIPVVLRYYAGSSERGSRPRSGDVRGR